MFLGPDLVKTVCSCADPESFVREAPTLTFFLVDEGR